TSPGTPVSLVVVAPHITSPTAGQVWKVGSSQNVTWDTSAIPATRQNSTGTLLLGYQDGLEGGEHLDIAHPLANYFPLSAGSVQVTVPNVTARTDYIVVLIGDSGNASPEFSIQA
ncbi:hypothetical protein EVG20_g10782, partial [Dentipellis fragilis]